MGAILEGMCQKVGMSHVLADDGAEKYERRDLQQANLQSVR